MARTRSRTKVPEPIPDERGASVPFPIVGIGASAGGLDAFTQLLHALPIDTGLAFVLVQHLAPTHISALAEILSRATKMPVTEVRDEPNVEPNHVYVIPPDRSMTIGAGKLQLLPREGTGPHHPIDQFFRSLAAERGHRAIGVVLSGTATDGTIGLEEIKAGGGITLAQDGSAQYRGMPDSAVSSGCVDFVRSPEGIARELVRISEHPYTALEGEDQCEADKTKLGKIVKILHHATGVDFSGYKLNTLNRRITRRMVFHKLDTVSEYVQYLRDTPQEVDALYQDILISVTSFFRDPGAFESLKSAVFPRLTEGRSRHEPVRVWTLGCSTGQEAYSLVMAFVEAAEALSSHARVQLFATDLNEACIAKARAGVYPTDIAQDVSPERLRRFFTEVNGAYRVTKEIRDVCVFSRHNVLADPPFSRIDLISCRNLLIYMEPVLQQRIMPTLHYALNPGGTLWLGSSETIGTYRERFEVLDARHKIYTKRMGADAAPVTFPSKPSSTVRPNRIPPPPRAHQAQDLLREADRLLLNKYAPPGVLVTASMDILQYRGDTGPYLAPSPGSASLNLLKMLREGLLVGIRSAVLRAGEGQVPVREEGLVVKSEGGERIVTVEVIPIRNHGASEGAFLILFEDSSPPAPANTRDLAPGTSTKKSKADRTEIARIESDRKRLELELEATRDYLQSLIEQLEAANEELQSANEEVQSANEELQSSNEELETSKEEIQSSNEELSTVNDELNARNAELHSVNDDLLNLLASVQIAIVILDADLRVRRFTPIAEKLFRLIPTDVGRPFTDISLDFQDLPELLPILADVMDSVTARDLEVRDKQGHWYSLRLRPYKTLDKKIDGVVLLLVDVHEAKHASERVRESEAHYHAIFDATTVGVCEFDPVTTQLLRVNERFAIITGYSSAELQDRKLFDLTHPEHLFAEEAGHARLLLGEIPTHTSEKRIIRKDGSSLWVHVTHNLVRDSAGRPTRGVGIVLDITERKEVLERIREVNRRLEAVFEESPVGMYLIDASLRVQQANRITREAFGEKESPIGKDLSELIHRIWLPQTADHIMRNFRHTLTSGKSYASPEFSEERSDRAVREYYDWEIHRITLPSGEQGVVCYFVDVAERVRMTNELRASATDAMEANYKKNEFLAMLAHELRNPLAPIRNGAHVLRTTMGNRPDVINIAEMMERQLGQMARLIDDLLDVSRISRGRIELRMRRVELGSAVQHASEACRVMMDRAHQTLRVELPDEHLYLDADPARIPQIIGNLLNNASKFTEEGGTIHLTVTRDGRMAEIRVRDDGIGIAEDRLASIFDMFVQLDTSLERSQGGLGIGLTLARTLVEMHGGTIAVQSKGAGHGSEFIVRLPLASKTRVLDDPRDAEADSAPHQLGSRRILVVDDNPDSAESMALLLSVNGHETQAAFDGLQALQAAADFKPDIVLLDIGLPKLNGYEAARKIRAEAWGQTMVLVALTGWGQNQDRQKSKEAGFDGHMVKPVEFSELVTLLIKLTRAKQH